MAVDVSQNVGRRIAIDSLLVSDLRLLVMRLMVVLLLSSSWWTFVIDITTIFIAIATQCRDRADSREALVTCVFPA